MEKVHRVRTALPQIVSELRADQRIRILHPLEVPIGAVPKPQPHDRDPIDQLAFLQHRRLQFGEVGLESEHLDIVATRLHRLGDRVDVLLRAGEVPGQELVNDECQLHRAARIAQAQAL